MYVYKPSLFMFGYGPDTVFALCLYRKCQNCSVPGNLYIFNFSVTLSNSEALDSDTSGYVV